MRNWRMPSSLNAPRWIPYTSFFLEMTISAGQPKPRCKDLIIEKKKIENLKNMQNILSISKNRSPKLFQCPFLGLFKIELVASLRPKEFSRNARTANSVVVGVELLVAFLCVGIENVRKECNHAKFIITGGKMLLVGQLLSLDGCHELRLSKGLQRGKITTAFIILCSTIGRGSRREKFDGRETLDTEAGCNALLLSGVHLGDLNLALQVRCQLFPGGLQILAMSTPRGVVFNHPEAIAVQDELVKVGVREHNHIGTTTAATAAATTG